MLRLIDSEHDISCDRCSFINPLDTRTSSFRPITTQRKLKILKQFKYINCYIQNTLDHWKKTLTVKTPPNRGW